MLLDRLSRRRRPLSRPRGQDVRAGAVGERFGDAGLSAVGWLGFPLASEDGTGRGGNVRRCALQSNPLFVNGLRIGGA